MGLLGHFLIAGLGLFAGVLFAEPSPPTPSIPIRHRDELSPMARALDTVLFGDVQWLNYRDRNPFVYWEGSNPAKFNAALDEVKRFRGDQFTKLAQRGKSEKEEFTRTVKDETRDLYQKDGLVSLPAYEVLLSWSLLNTNLAKGERALTQAEINLRANATVEAAMRGIPRGTDEGLAGQIYNRAYNQIEIFETVPEQDRVNRDEFEAWREKEVGRLAGIIRQNLLRQIEGQYRQGLHPIRAREIDADGQPVKNARLAGQQYSKETVVPFSEVQKRLSHPIVQRRYDKDRLTFSSGTQFSIRAEPNQQLLAYGVDLGRSQTPNGSYNRTNQGYLSVSDGAEGHLSAVLQSSTEAAKRAIERLNQFQYDQYRKDGGANFLRRWRKELRGDSQILKKTFETPDVTTSKHLGNEIEEALWGRFAEDPNFWKKQSERRDYLLTAILDPSPTGYRSAEPPKNSLVAKTVRAGKRHPLVTTALAGLLSWSGIQALPWESLRPEPGPLSSSLQNLSAQTLATNKLLPKNSATLYHLFMSESRDGAPLRFSFGNPTTATSPVEVPATRTGTDFRVTNPRSHFGTLELPTGDGVSLGYLTITGRQGQNWEPGKDYDVRQTPTGEYVVFPKREESYWVEAGFNGETGPQPELRSPALRSLDLTRLEAVATELRGNGFKYLPDLLNQVVRVSRQTGQPVSVYDLETILRESALYSQRKEKSQFFGLLRSEFSRASRFLNPEGVSCYMCDGSRELGVALYKKVLGEKARVEVVPRSVVVRNSGARSLETSGLHADFVLRDLDTGEKIVLDTTPSEKDPRDLIPHPEGQVQASPPYVGGGRSPELIVGSELKKPQPGETSSPTEKAPPAIPFPWKERVTEFFDLLERAHHREVERELPRRPLIGGSGPPGEKGEANFDEPGSNAETHFVHAEVPTEVREATVVTDPKLSELDSRLRNYFGLLAELKLFAHGDRIPSSSAAEIAKLLKGYLDGTVSEAEFKQKMSLHHLPKDFAWPLVTSTGLGKIVEAARKHLHAKFEQHRRRFEKGETKAFPALLDYRVQRAVNDLLQWTAQQEWKLAHTVYTEPITPGCHNLMGRLGSSAVTRSGANEVALKF